MAELTAQQPTTLNGKFDARCVSCGCAPYVLWISDEPPPPGCAEGHDADISRCGWVYNRLVSLVIRQDCLKQPLAPQHEDILRRLGPKAEPILARIRAGAMPPENEPGPIKWSLSQ